MLAPLYFVIIMDTETVRWSEQKKNRKNRNLRGENKKTIKSIVSPSSSVFLFYIHSLLSKGIISVRPNAVTLFNCGKVHKVRRSMNLVVELFRICQVKVVLHVGIVTNTHKVVVPRALRGYHEKPKELVRKEHLHALVMGRQVSFGVVASVCVLFAPIEA